MRQLLLILSLLFTASTMHGQDNWVSYMESVDVAEHQGKKFRVKAFAKISPLDEDAGARLWARVEKTDKSMGFFNNMMNNPVQSREWKPVVMEGTIDEDASKLFFGLLLQYNGTFNFDDLEVEVVGPKGKWIRLFKEDFEGTTIDIAQGIDDEGKKGLNDKFVSALDRTNYKNGKQGLAVTGKGVPNFGVNTAIGKFAAVNGIKLYYEVYGTGKPLVVLHGNGGSIQSAAGHYPKLMEKYKVIAIDSRGQGKSTDTDAPLTYEQMASDVSALLDQLQIDSANIWGQSDGAILGLILAMDHPKKVRRVIAYGSNVQPDSSAVFSWGINAITRGLSTAGTTKEKKLMQLMLDHPHIPYARLSNIVAPVLVMSGDRDVIRPEHTLKIFQSIPNSHLCILPGSTHGGAWEKKDLFFQLMNDFFEKPFSKPDTRSWFE